MELMSLSEQVVREFLASQEDSWVTRDQIAKLCPECATKMASMGISRVRATALFDDERLMAAALQTRILTAGKWDKLPKGWTQKSLKSFWENLTGDRKHKVTACIKKIEGSGGIDDAGAFCASLADKMEPGWRSER